MRTANPALNDATFENVEHVHGANAMSLNGTAFKTLVLLGLCALSAGYTWQLAFAGSESLPTWIVASALTGLALAVFTSFAPRWAAISGPAYAVAKGLFLGAISALAEARFPGIVIQAVGLTFGTMMVLLLTYMTGLIRPSENFKLGVVAATGGVFVLYLVSFGMNLAGMHMPYIHDNSWIGIGFSMFVVVLASLNLVLDFDYIEKGVARGAPKYLEWYAAFGLMVTLVWLYVEILRLLAKLQSRK